MKEILILIVLLTLSLTGVYFFQEIKEREAFEAKKTENMFYNPREMGKLIAVDFPRFKAFKYEDEWKFEGFHWKIDQKKMNEYLTYLESVRIVRPLALEQINEAGKEHFFSDDATNELIKLYFENGELSLKKGRRIPQGMSFYFAISSREGPFEYYISHSEAPIARPHLSSERNEVFYRILQEIYSLRPSTIADLYALSKDLRAEITQIEFSTPGQRRFRIQASPLTTHPPPFPGVTLKDNETLSFFNSITHLIADDLLEDFSDEKLDDYAGTILFWRGDYPVYAFSLFRSYGENYGFFLKAYPAREEENSENSFLYILSQGQERIFYHAHQDFWNKIPIAFKEEQQEISFIEVKTSDKSVIEDYFKSPSDFISRRSIAHTPLEEFGENLSILEIDGQKIFFMESDREVQVIRKHESFYLIYHYLRGNTLELMDDL